PHPTLWLVTCSIMLCCGHLCTFLCRGVFLFSVLMLSSQEPSMSRSLFFPLVLSHCSVYFSGSETEQSCVYRLSKNISSSDSGTYYCAVATCGEILFGNGTKLDSRVFTFNTVSETRVWSQTASSIIFLLCTVLAISLIVIVALIWMIKKNSDHCRGNSNCIVLYEKEPHKSYIYINCYLYLLYSS
uniref:Immunoglobulin subtype domain-containing protein n=1 Tax=Haplochromis burtoni TaxID=8153 RepID=A0A3Q2X9G0_HAPBU